MGRGSNGSNGRVTALSRRGTISGFWDGEAVVEFVSRNNDDAERERRKKIV